MDINKIINIVRNLKEEGDWRSDLEVVDESAKVMLKIGKRVWKTPGVRKFTSKVPGNLSRATKINPLTKSHALTKQTNSFSVKPLERGSKAGERLAPDRTTLKLDSNMGRPKPKNMALNTETGDYVTKLKKSNYELVPGAKYGDKVMAKNYKQELKDKEIRKQIEALRKAREPKGIKDKSDINQAALKILKKESYSWRSDLEFVEEGDMSKLPGLGGGGGGTNAITMKSSDKSVGKRIKDVGNLVKRPFRTKEDRLNVDPRSKFATEEIANSLGGGGIAGTIEGSGYDPNFTPPVDKKKKKKNRRKQVIGMWSRQLRKKK